MKKTNINYRPNFIRTNERREKWVNYFISVCSYPKLLIEVFIREKFGPRYFNLWSAYRLVIMLFVIPLYLHTIGMTYDYFSNGGVNFKWGTFLFHYLSWYALLAAFLVRSYKHHKAMRRPVGEFDWDWYSKSSGIISPYISSFTYGDWKPSYRQLEILVEPAIPFVLGLLLIILHQPIGFVLVICAVIYSRSYAAAYYLGDCEIQDWIDVQIHSKVQEKLYLEDTTPEDAMGFTYRSTRPSSKEMRNEMYQQMMKDQEDIPEVG